MILTQDKEQFLLLLPKGKFRSLKNIILMKIKHKVFNRLGKVMGKGSWIKTKWKFKILLLSKLKKMRVNKIRQWFPKEKKMEGKTGQDRLHNIKFPKE